MNKYIRPDDLVTAILDNHNLIGQGMTVRTALAMAAMQGMLSSVQSEDSISMDQRLIASMAVRQADALIEELNKEKP